MAGKKIQKRNIGEELIQGLKEVDAHLRGEIKLRTWTVELPDPAPRWTAKQIKKLRTEVFEMSQSAFAMLVNVKLSTIRSWEQGQKSPSGAAARVLQLLSMDKSLAKKLAA